MTSAIIDWIIDALKQFLCWLIDFFLDIGLFVIDLVIEQWPGSEPGTSGFAEWIPTLLVYWNLGNSWFPMSEVFVLGTALVSFRVTIGVVRWVTKFIPLIGGS